MYHNNDNGVSGQYNFMYFKHRYKTDKSFYSDLDSHSPRCVSVLLPHNWVRTHFYKRRVPYERSLVWLDGTRTVDSRAVEGVPNDLHVTHGVTVAPSLRVRVEMPGPQSSGPNYGVREPTYSTYQTVAMLPLLLCTGQMESEESPFKEFCLIR